LTWIKQNVKKQIFYCKYINLLKSSVLSTSTVKIGTGNPYDNPSNYCPKSFSSRQGAISKIQIILVDRRKNFTLFQASYFFAVKLREQKIQNSLPLHRLKFGYSVL
jgi:hypothetical protein